MSPFTHEPRRLSGHLTDRRLRCTVRHRPGIADDMRRRPAADPGPNARYSAPSTPGDRSRTRDRPLPVLEDRWTSRTHTEDGSISTTDAPTVVALGLDRPPQVPIRRTGGTPRRSSGSPRELSAAGTEPTRSVILTSSRRTADRLPGGLVHLGLGLRAHPLRPPRPHAPGGLLGHAPATEHRPPHASVAGEHADRDEHVAEDHRRHDDRRPQVDLREHREDAGRRAAS